MVSIDLVIFARGEYGRLRMVSIDMMILARGNAGGDIW